ncbi:unnamed protein product [Cylindrotheca closterium]|uniref:Phosphodiesterase n=1 Tax=Cylindrotheca closterium TaxID=2856 RepID=A0AAD2PWJ3_9STRA|nr:unnamed protein product [Cylindrotheca closterium]
MSNATGMNRTMSKGSLKRRSTSQELRFAPSHEEASSLFEVDDSSKGRNSDTEKTTIEDDEFERTAIRCFRFYIFFLMVVSTITAGVITWHFLNQAEEDDFHKEFEVIAEDIRLLSNQRTLELVTDSNTLGQTISSLAINSKTSWPFFTDFSFPLIASNFISTTSAHLVILSPLIQNEEERIRWTNYSQTQQAWIGQGLVFEQQQKDSFIHNHDHNEHEEEEEDMNLEEIFAGIFRAPNGMRTLEEGSGPFLPIWQTFEPSTKTTSVNFNLLSDRNFVESFETVMATKQPLLTDRFDKEFQDIIPLLDEDDVAYFASSPFSMLVQPVYTNASSDEIVAILNSDVNWVSLFSLSSDESLPPVDVVVDDQCGQKFTLRLTGPKSIFLAFDDLHDPAFNVDEIDFPFAELLQTHHVAGTDCKYQVRVFPTQEFFDTFHTSSPSSTAAIIGTVFAFMCIIFCLYDAAVHMRQKRILTVASQSEKILSVLYPKSIRDRLFGYEEEEDPAEGKTPSGIRGRLNHDLRKTAAKYQLKQFMTTTRPGDEMDHALNPYDSKPIADLFLHATVLFADISGFTAWSSVREPSQVFTLLEAVYNGFDMIAKRRKVFKVETVGDCYVAVTGLPEPTKSHATIMAGFARECVEKFAQLVRVLETTLGPDTGDLGIRVGIHSGPVTAGVLRGDKSRFQLFGDTVNTASRIESTGKRNRIHLSEETADLLAVAGKSHWLRSRDQPVTAKGKGKLHTYWLMTKQEEAGVVITSNSGSADKLLDNASGSFNNIPSGIAEASLDLRTNSLEEIEKLLPPKTRRLCQWNVDVLTRLLKQVVAHRLATNEGSKGWENELTKREQEIRSQISVLDEVVEIIPLPGFDQRVYKRQQDPDKIELSDQVIEQIRLYVACIAAMYRDNPFHNFDHASHVMMSVSKLLSRIVAADDVLDEDENAATSDDLGWSIHDHTYGITSDPMTQFTVILAAMIHDVDHSGVSNNQLIKEGNKLANLFRNKSVAEQNSTVLAWDILMDPRFQDFRRTIYAAPYELDRFRQLMTNTVLATDIMDKELQGLRRNRWDAAFKTNSAMSEATKDMVNRKATIVIEHLIQASDVAHTMQHWHIYCKWNERLFEEMTIAYKAGRLGFNPAEKWYEGEIGFFDNYVIPLAKKLKNCGVFGVASDEYLNYAMENRREWEEKGRDLVATLTEQHMG